jgi:hypothetical protein
MCKDGLAVHCTKAACEITCHAAAAAATNAAIIATAITITTVCIREKGVGGDRGDRGEIEHWFVFRAAALVIAACIS